MTATEAWISDQSKGAGFRNHFGGEFLDGMSVPRFFLYCMIIEQE